MNMMNDTIAAIATANATGAVSIIRISGEEAILIASELINKDLSKKKDIRLHLVQYRRTMKLLMKYLYLFLEHQNLIQEKMLLKLDAMVVYLSQERFCLYA